MGPRIALHAVAGVTTTVPAARWRSYLALGRVSNLPTVWTNVLAGVSLGGARLDATLLVTMLSMTFAYVGGMFLNDAFDRDFDARVRPDRPIASGAVSATEVFGVGFGLLAGSLGLIAATTLDSGAWDATLSAGGLVGCIVLYDAWHKNNAMSPVLMGMCRALVYATAAFASGAGPSVELLAGSGALAAYVAGLTFVARQEHRRSFGGVWPLFLLALPAGVIFLGATDQPVVLLTMAAFLVWSAVAVAPLFGTGSVDVHRSVVRMIAGISLADAMMIAAFGPTWIAAAGILGLVLTLQLQRWVTGT